MYGIHCFGVLDRPARLRPPDAPPLPLRLPKAPGVPVKPPAPFSEPPAPLLKLPPPLAPPPDGRDVRGFPLLALRLELLAVPFCAHLGSGWRAEPRRPRPDDDRSASRSSLRRFSVSGLGLRVSPHQFCS